MGVSIFHNMTKEEIISFLPYSKPFLFVDKIEKIDDNSVTGTCRFSGEEFFYKGHFTNFPVTPGVILIETMAQIGLVCLGIFIMNEEIKRNDLLRIAMVSSDVEFLLPVYPGEEVKVVSDKVYFRFGKLKCNVKMFNSNGHIVCKGSISGMVGNKKDV